MPNQEHTECEKLEVSLARLEVRFEATQDALVHARTEMNRRMEELNDVRNRFLPREVFDREHASLQLRVTSTEARIGSLEQSKAGLLGTVAGYGTIISFLMASAGLLIYFLRR